MNTSTAADLVAADQKVYGLSRDSQLNTIMNHRGRSVDQSKFKIYPTLPYFNALGGLGDVYDFEKHLEHNLIKSALLI